MLITIRKLQSILKKRAILIKLSVGSLVGMLVGIISCRMLSVYAREDPFFFATIVRWKFNSFFGLDSLYGQEFFIVAYTTMVSISIISFYKNWKMYAILIVFHLVFYFYVYGPILFKIYED